MKTRNSLRKYPFSRGNLSAILAAGALFPSFGFGAPASTPAPADSQDWLSRRLQQLGSAMDSVFADTYRRFEPGIASSVDLEDQKDRYQVRVYVPDKKAGGVNVALDDHNVLRIEAAPDSASGQFVQTLTLPGPVDAGKMTVNKKDDLVVISIPKASGSAPAVAASSPPATKSPLDENDDIDPGASIIRQMERMQDRMEQMFQDSLSSSSGSFLDAANPASGFGSAVNLDNRKDAYVVRFYLPDQNLSDVKVNIDDKNQLKLSAAGRRDSQSAAGTGSEVFSESGQYQEMLTLPGPVHADRMKVERKNGIVTVTLPKA